MILLFRKLKEIEITYEAVKGVFCQFIKVLPLHTTKGLHSALTLLFHTATKLWEGHCQANQADMVEQLRVGMWDQVELSLKQWMKSNCSTYFGDPDLSYGKKKVFRKAEEEIKVTSNNYVMHGDSNFTFRFLRSLLK